MTRTGPQEQAIQRNITKTLRYLRKTLDQWGALHPPQEPIDVPGLDAGIRYAVAVLRASGIETYQSCEGGDGHSFPEPTVQFHGDASEGYRGLAACLVHDLPVFQLRRTWYAQRRELEGPHWEIVFERSPVIPVSSEKAWRG